ncbi:MAG: hypothetical protein ABI162_06805 [Luteolibacter sp.]
MSYKLLGVNTDAKTIKGLKHGFITGVLYMAPHTLAGGRTLCPHSTAGCRAVCLYSAGRGAFNNVQTARIRKAQWWLNDPLSFKVTLCQDIAKLCVEAKKKGLKPNVRLNGTTDIRWENEGIFEQFKDVQFMDYTKFPASGRKLPDNYHLTYSYAGTSKSLFEILRWNAKKINTAVVFRGGLPTHWQRFPVIDGDLHDLRFLDPKGVIVGLKTKGKARNDSGGGFVQDGPEFSN